MMTLKSVSSQTFDRLRLRSFHHIEMVPKKDKSVSTMVSTLDGDSHEPKSFQHGAHIDFRFLRHHRDYLKKPYQW